ncbi:hypothetical protein AnigIFM62618_005496 [Aspergillus niger]|nr:hypothetical protein AnigIFM62618_005496 [Aspergillus niger]
MKAFNLLLLWISVLSTHVLANNNAAPYELLYYYYVYKLEWDTGIERTIATGCVSKEGGGMCYFDEFAMYLIEPEWQIRYRPKGAVDHTKTPGLGAATKLFTNMPGSASYDLKKLLPSINADAKSFPLVFETVLHSANNAIAQDNVDKDDLEQALEMVQEVKEIREADVFQDQEDMLKGRIGAEAYEYVVYAGPNEFDWQDTFQAIDDGVKAKTIGDEDARTLKETIREFSLSLKEDIVTGTASYISHMNILRALATSITSLTEGIEEKFPESNDASSSSSPSDTCEIEFVND